ncbi:unnamed protein product [Arabidopsis halleri]
MGELRDVIVQYTSCADPTESAARKQRVLQGEARGLMAQTAEMIVAAATLTNHSFLETVASPSDNLPDKSQDLPVHPADIPVSTLPNAKKRRGRPPLNKLKPTQLTGSKSSKRNKVLIQNSPKRRNTPERVGQPEVTINSTCKGSKAKQRLNLQGEEHNPSSSNALPKTTLIPAMVKDRVDFQNPPKLQSLGYPGTNLVSPHSPGGGGLALLWKQHIDLEVLSACSNFIDTRIRAEGKTFFASFVYGEPDKTKRKAIWDQLSVLGQSRAESWPMGPPTEESHRLTVDYLISPASLDWNKEKIKQILPDLESEILEIKLSKLGAADAYVWLPAKNGTYTAKSGYYTSVNATNEETSPQHDPLKDFNWKMHIWNTHCSPKSKFFLWKAMRGALPVGENLRYRGINATAACPFCGENESTLHLFFTCSFAKQVWTLAPFKFPLDPHSLTSFREGIEKARDLTCLPPTGIGLGPLHPWILWKIWLARNQQIFDHRHDPPQETLSQAIFLAREWQAAQTQIEKPIPKRIPEMAPRLDPDVIVCHSDAAWNEESKTAGLGWIFANQASGLKQQGSSTSRHIRSPLMAEALAVHLALTHATDLGNKIRIIEAGALKPIITFLQSDTTTLQEYAAASLLTLSASPTNKPIIGAYGAIPHLVKLIKHGSPQTDDSRKTSNECGLFALVEVLENGTLQGREYAVEDLGSDIISHIDGDDQCGEAKKMLAEMVKVTMQKSLRHLQEHASPVPKNRACLNREPCFLSSLPSKRYLPQNTTK